MCPPSSAGIGNRFSTPKFTEMSATMVRSTLRLILAAFEVTSAICTIPPTSFSGTAPTTSFSKLLKMSFEASTVSPKANFRLSKPV